MLSAAMRPKEMAVPIETGRRAANQIETLPQNAKKTAPRIKTNDTA